MADFFPNIDDLEAEFPEFNSPGDEFIAEEESNEDAPPEPYGISWKFDFNKGDMYTTSSGKFVETSLLDTLHEWVGHVLNTERWETTIFSGDIGTEINSMIGARNTHDAATLARIEEEVLRALHIHDRIDTLTMLTVLPVAYDIYTVFQYSTDDGETVTEITNV